MAYLHADYELETTDEARLAKLLQHIAEVEAESAPDVNWNGTSVARGNMETKLARLNERRRELNRSIARSGGVSIMGHM